jgi:hypothetical protein
MTNAGAQEHVLSAAAHHHRNDLNIYEGKRVTGKVEVTVRRGEVVWRDGRLQPNVRPGTGRFLPLPVFDNWATQRDPWQGMVAMVAADTTKECGAAADLGAVAATHAAADMSVSAYARDVGDGDSQRLKTEL